MPYVHWMYQLFLVLMLKLNVSSRLLAWCDQAAMHRPTGTELNWKSFTLPVRPFHRYRRGSNIESRYVIYATHLFALILHFWYSLCSINLCIKFEVCVFVCSIDRDLGRVAFQDRSRSVASSASVIGWETRPVLILATGRGFATRPWFKCCWIDDGEWIF